MLPISFLHGTRVLLIGNYVPAPLAAYLLRAMGAEVVKVESDHGDYLRQIGKIGDDPNTAMSPMFRTLNGGFKSIALQTKIDQGAAILRELISQADILIDGSRKGALERTLGGSPESIAPHIIYVSLTAYGLTGPLSHLAGHDNNILALGGNLSYTETTADGLPATFSAPVADIFAGQSAAFAAASALLGRKAGNTAPIRIDASMLHAGFFLNLLEVSERNDPHWQVPQPGKAWMNGGRADYRTYPTSDGKAIFFGLLEPWALERFLKGIQRPDLIPFIGKQNELKEALSAIFATKPQSEWVQIGTQLDACISPVNDIDKAIHEPQIAELGLVQELNDPRLGKLELPTLPFGFGETSQQPRLPQTAPLLGEHTAAVLQDWLGWDQDRILNTLKAGIASQNPQTT
ncbi:MAG: CaiB/BaiF CoA-transferase family protein [Bacteroidia bacterium]